MKLGAAVALTLPLKPFWVPIRFSLSKKWRKRLKKVKGIAIKVGILVVGAALSTVTGGASAVIAAAALAALAARDKKKAEAAQAAARAKVARGMEANQALMEAVAENQVELAHVISSVVNGTAQPFTQDPGTQEAIQGALGFSPMPGTQGPPILETLGVAFLAGGVLLIAGAPLALAAVAAGVGAVADRSGLVGKFFSAVKGK